MMLASLLIQISSMSQQATRLSPRPYLKPSVPVASEVCELEATATAYFLASTAVSKAKPEAKAGWRENNPGIGLPKKLPKQPQQPQDPPKPHIYAEQKAKKIFGGAWQAKDLDQEDTSSEQDKATTSAKKKRRPRPGRKENKDKKRRKKKKQKARKKAERAQLRDEGYGAPAASSAQQPPAASSAQQPPASSSSQQPPERQTLIFLITEN